MNMNLDGTRHVTTALAAILLFGACSGGDVENDVPAAEARIAVNPTATGELPAAILGEAPSPQGVGVAYFPEGETTLGYLAVPEGAGPFPSLLLVHEWDGLKDRVRQVADAMAAEGYVALAVDLFQGQTGSNPTENRALMAGVRDSPGEMIANLDAAAAFLRVRSDVTGKVAAMGWCFGGGIALSYGLGGEHHDGTAIFYGSLLADPDSLARLNHEVYGTFAELDRGISPESVNEFVDALEQAGIENDVHVYDHVDHGFWLRVDEDPDVRGVPALDAWTRLKAYLERALS